MTHIFVSYSRQDIVAADRLVDELEVAGHTVWIDRRSLRGGQPWRAQIARAIEKCLAFVVLLSPRSVVSDSVTRELSLANEDRKPIVPVVVESTDIPAGMRFQLAQEHYIDLSSDFDVGITDVLDALIDYLDDDILEFEEDIVDWGAFGDIDVDDLLDDDELGSIIDHGVGHAFSADLELVAALRQLQLDGEDVTQVAISFDGAWTILHGVDGFWTEGVPENFLNELWAHDDSGSDIDNVAFDPDGGWVILSDLFGFTAQDVPEDLLDQLNEYNAEGSEIKQVAFTPNGGWVVLVEHNGYATAAVPDDLVDVLAELNAAGDEIRQVAFPPDYGWLVLSARTVYWASDVPITLLEQLDDYRAADDEVQCVAFAPNDGWVTVRRE